MKQNISLLFLFFVLFGNSQTQCDSVINKLMHMGDSWAKFSFDFGSIPTNLDRFGFTNVGMYSDNDIAVNGAVSADFLTPTGKAAIQNAFATNPEIEWVNLSIGGNDILNSWNNSMDSVSTDSLLDATMARIDSIIEFIKGIKPQAKIHIPGYDFANFGEVIPTAAVPTFHPFYGRWDGMGQPDFMELNSLLTRASTKFAELVSNKQNVFYTNALGLMQYLYGQTVPLGVNPAGTYQPRTVPLPGGRLDYPTPKSMMNDYVIFTDCFHLNSEGYEMFYKYHFEEYFWDELRNKKNITIASEGGNKDGGVTSLSSLSPANITIGNNATAGISKGIVSFNTSSVSASTLIHSGNLFLHRNNLTGNLPVFNKVMLEVKQGNFGTSTSLDFGDYSSPADELDTACVYGSLKENGYWLRIKVPASLLSEINTAGSTQFRISMIDSTDGSTLFYSTGDSTDKPFLELEYFNPASVEENEKQTEISLFPNPSGNAFISVANLNDFEGEVSATDISGRQFPVTYSRSQLDISKLASGTYFIVFKDKEFTQVKRFVKL
ncbi:MAG: T9SS type A sorting domain-containing protein [Flavobacteriales bacterium]